MTKLAQHLTPNQAAERLTKAGIPISGEAVRQWLKAGRLASLRLPSGRRLIRVEDVDAIITGENVEAAS